MTEPLTGVHRGKRGWTMLGSVAVLLARLAGFTTRTYARFIPDDAPEAGQRAVEIWSTDATTFGQHLVRAP
jgi:hypothetical protein